MLDAICGHIHNWFTRPGDVREGRFVVSDGALELDFLTEGQCFRILGSALNDGVYVYPAEGLRDEAFEGEIWPMRAPAGFVALADEIAAWDAKYGAAAAGPYRSESFGGYSYSRVGGDAPDGAAWQRVFKRRLDVYRRLA
ncbi:MAG: hypothetical protein IJ646_00905 [Clostridia bacterium]|nr:hypothetical protein [Clostridia bacterium]